MGEVEIWKDITGYKGLYQASSIGRFKSLKSGKIITPTYVDARNIYSLGLRDRKGKNKTFIPSRIIAQLFIPNPNKYSVVKCKSDKRNLNPSNWYWAISKRSKLITKEICEKCKMEFIHHTKNKRLYCSKKCYGLARRGKPHNLSEEGRKNMAESKYKKVIATKGNSEVLFNSINEAALCLRRSASAVSNALAGRWKTVNGWKVKFIK